MRCYNQRKVSHLSLPVIVHLQGLTVSGEARDAHETLLIDLEHTLEVAVDGHQLGGKTRICRNSHAVLALHGKHRVSVIFVLYRAKENIHSQYLLRLSRSRSVSPLLEMPQGAS